MKLYVLDNTGEEIDDKSLTEPYDVIVNLHEDCLCLIEAIKKFENEGTAKSKLEMFDLLK